MNMTPLTQQDRNPRGRPFFNSTKGKMIPTMLHLYGDQREAIAKEAKRQETTWAAIVRQLIDQYLCVEAMAR